MTVAATGWHLCCAVLCCRCSSGAFATKVLAKVRESMRTRGTCCNCCTPPCCPSQPTHAPTNPAIVVGERTRRSVRCVLQQLCSTLAALHAAVRCFPFLYFRLHCHVILSLPSVAVGHIPPRGPQEGHCIDSAICGWRTTPTPCNKTWCSPAIAVDDVRGEVYEWSWCAHSQSRTLDENPLQATP